MKKWFIDKFPGLLAVILIGYACYESGYMKSKTDLMKATSVCTRELFNHHEEQGGMHKFYGHKTKGAGNAWNHASALVELEWSRCFRKGLHK
jgi:hypothetical protein